MAPGSGSDRWGAVGVAQMTVRIEPAGWPTTLGECPAGFFWFHDRLCFKSEYVTDESMDCFNEAGEYFVGGTVDETERRLLKVQPVTVVMDD